MDKLIKFIARHSQKILWIVIISYVTAMFLVCLWKYSHFLYNGMDLAIFNNVLFNTLNGNFSWSSIQGHSYLGDHFSPILLLILPFYYLWPSPILLLLIQSLFLGLAAWPLYKISLDFFQSKNGAWDNLEQRERQPFQRGTDAEKNAEQTRKLLSLLIGLLWLLNPLLHNVNLYEFSTLAFLPFFLFTLFYFYLKHKENWANKWSYNFIILWLLCLMIREDIALIMILLGILILWENKKNKRILVVSCLSLVVSLIWSLVAAQIIAYYSPSNFSPFIIYYGWLRQASASAIISHLFTSANSAMIIGGLLPLLFIPLIKPKWLLLTLIPMAQIILSAAGGGFYVWKLHYALLFLPAIFLCLIYSFEAANNFVDKYLKAKYVLPVALIIINIYLWVDFGPFQIKIHPNLAIVGEESREWRVWQRDPSSALRPPRDKMGGSSILASYRYLPNFSSRQNIYALNYYFLDSQQYGATEYELTAAPAYIIVDINDLLSFDVQLKNLDWSKKYYGAGDNRLRELLKNYGVMDISGETILFQKGEQNKFELYAVIRNQKSEIPGRVPRPRAGRNPVNIFDNNIELLNSKILPITGYQLQITLIFTAQQKVTEGYQLLIEFTDGNNNYQKILPMAYGLYPTSEWQAGEKIAVNYWLNLPVALVSEQAKINLSLVELKGGNEVNKMGMSEIVIDEIKKVGKTLELND